MTLQEIFDKTTNAIIAQGGPSLTRKVERGCAYRGVNGRKCAIGHLIPDELYDKDIEGGGFQALLDEHPELATHFKTISTDKKAPRLLESLQYAHDAAVVDSSEYYFDSYKREIVAVAERFGLSLENIQWPGNKEPSE